MISVYDVSNTFYARDGDAVLTPLMCEVTEDAGASYELSLTHPIDAGEKWRHLVNGAIIKAPVPVPTIENAYVGQDVDVYKTIETTSIHSGPSESTRITYQSWSAGTEYVVGSRVTNSGYDNHNYQCIQFDSSSGMMFVPPNNNSAWWKRISDYSSGSPEIAQVPTDTEVYFVEDAGDGWYKISTKNGIIGYVKSSSLVFVRHETVEPVPPRTVEDQLFRIYNVSISSDEKTCRINARHVSYDLTGVLLGDCNIALADPPVAIARIRNAMLITYQGEIATNLTADDNGTYTGDLSYKNGIFALLDPDKGIIPVFRAKLIRDNWDLFLMKNEDVDRGIRIVYGNNLRGVNWKRNSDGIITRVMPVAKAADGSDLFLPEKWIDSPLINQWPIIVIEKLAVAGQVGKDDGTGTETTWTEETLLEQMRTKAEERFSVDHVDAIKVEIDVNFILLGNTDEYKQYHDLEKLYMYDTITVYDSKVGLDQQLQVSRIVWDCIRERYVSIRVGSVYDYGGRTVSGYNIGNGAIAYEKISSEAVRQIIAEAN